MDCIVLSSSSDDEIIVTSVEKKPVVPKNEKEASASKDEDDDDVICCGVYKNPPGTAPSKNIKSSKPTIATRDITITKIPQRNEAVNRVEQTEDDVQLVTEPLESRAVAIVPPVVQRPAPGTSVVSRQQVQQSINRPELSSSFTTIVHNAGLTRQSSRSSPVLNPMANSSRMRPLPGTVGITISSGPNLPNKVTINIGNTSTSSPSMPAFRNMGRAITDQSVPSVAPVVAVPTITTMNTACETDPIQEKESPPEPKKHNFARKSTKPIASSSLNSSGSAVSNNHTVRTTDEDRVSNDQNPSHSVPSASGVGNSPSLHSSTTAECRSVSTCSTSPLVKLDEKSCSNDKDSSNNKIKDSEKKKKISLETVEPSNEKSSKTDDADINLESSINANDRNDDYDENNTENDDYDENNTENDDEDDERESKSVPSSSEAEEETVNDEVVYLFKKFLSKCEKIESGGFMNRAKLRLNKYFDLASVESLNSPKFTKKLEKSMDVLQNKSMNPYKEMKEILDFLKANKKDDEKLTKLEDFLERLNKKIEELENEEVTSDDDENNSYMKLERYQKRAVEVYKKICEYSGLPATADRAYLRKISFDCAINSDISGGSKSIESLVALVSHSLEKYFNKYRKFPDFRDVKKLLEKFIVLKNVSMTLQQVHCTAEIIFSQFGKMLQKRRAMDDHNILMEFVKTDFDDPADSDPVLAEKLRQNRNKGTKEVDILNKFVLKQESKGSCDVTDISTQVSSDSDLEKNDSLKKKRKYSSSSSSTAIGRSSNRKSKVKEKRDSAVCTSSSDEASDESARKVKMKKKKKKNVSHSQGKGKGTKYLDSSGTDDISVSSSD